MARMREIFGSSQRTELERSIVTAARIAGKAHVAIRREDVYLLYAIAIESLIVGGNEQIDLTYKLSTRCAHLLGTELNTRRRIKDEIKLLYGIRSGIVHRGQSSFPDEDLGRIRRYVAWIIQRFLVDEDLRPIETKKQLSSWFDERILA